MNTNKKNYSLYILAFILPIIILMWAYYKAGIFINHALLINDLHTQYSTFLSYYQNSILENGILYSFSKGMGGNFYGVFTYYLMSPLNLISFLFKPENLEYAIMMIMLIKSGLSGLTSFIFLSNQDSKKDIIAVSFSLFYALSSCFVVWHYHILWSDAFYLLPLIILGVQKILSNKSSKLFIISFTACLIINYYMAYMIAIFVLVYFVYHAIINFNKKEIASNFIKMAKSTVISALLSLFVLVPTLYSLLQGKLTYNDSIGLAVNNIVFNILDIAPKLLNSSYDSVGTVSAPFIYSGSAVFILAIAFFTLKNISKKEKYASMFVVLSLTISLVVKPLYLAFHMFSAPNAFPYRFVFLLNFFLIFIAYKAYRNYKEIDKKKFLIVVLAFILIILTLTVLYQNPINLMGIILTIIFAFSTILILFSAKRNKIILSLIFLIAIFDMGINTTSLIQKNYIALSYEEKGEFKTSYIHNTSEIEKIETEEFFRIYTNNINDSFKYGFNNFYESFTSLPENNSEYIKNTYLLPSTYSQVTNAIFSVKYNLLDGQISSEMQTFPLLFTASADILTKNNSTVENFMYNLYEIEYIDENGIINEAFDEIILKANSNIENLVQDKNKITATITANDESTYVLSSIIYDRGWEVKVNGEKVETERILENLLAFQLNSTGENIVELSYYPVGYKMSVGISALTATVLIGYNVRVRKKNEKI